MDTEVSFDQSREVERSRAQGLAGAVTSSDAGIQDNRPQPRDIMIIQPTNTLKGGHHKRYDMF